MDKWEQLPGRVEQRTQWSVQYRQQCYTVPKQVTTFSSSGQVNDDSYRSAARGSAERAAAAGAACAPPASTPTVSGAPRPSPRSPPRSADTPRVPLPPSVSRLVMQINDGTRGGGGTASFIIYKRAWNHLCLLRSLTLLDSFFTYLFVFVSLTDSEGPKFFLSTSHRNLSSDPPGEGSRVLRLPGQLPGPGPEVLPDDTGESLPAGDGR